MTRRIISLLIMLIVAGAFSGVLRAENFTVPPLKSTDANNASFNVHDAIVELRQHGFRAEADRMEDLLSKGRLYYQVTGKESEDNSAHTTHEDAVADGKLRIRLGHQHVSNNVIGFGEEPTRHAGGNGLASKFMTAKTTLHELTHADQKLKFIQDGNDSYYEHNGPAWHELDAFRKSLKAYADEFVVASLRRYLEDKQHLNDGTDAQKLYELQAKVLALEQGLVPRNKDEEVGPIGQARDRACRWKTIERELEDLFDDIFALRRDARSREACKEGLSDYRDRARAAKADLPRLGAKIDQANADIKAVRQTFATREQNYKSLRAELENPATSSTRRAEIAQSVGDLDGYLEQTRSQLNQLATRRKETRQKLRETQKQLTFTTGKVASIEKNLDKCRLEFVQREAQSRPIDPKRLPPDMQLSKAGKVEYAPPGKERNIDLEARAKRVEDMFDYDSDKIRQAEDPRTPCFCGVKVGQLPATSPATTAGGQYVIMLDKGAEPDVNLTDKSAGIGLTRPVCAQQG